MHRELSRLDGFVRKNLNPSAFLHLRRSQAFDASLTAIKRDLALLCDYMLDRGSEIHNDNEIGIFINHYARTVLTLFEVLKTYCNQSRNILKGTVRRKYQILIKQVCSEFDGFLSFVQTRYGKYFDYTLSIPFTVSASSKKQLRKDLRSLEAIFKMPGIDPKAVNFALLPIRYFIKHNKIISYKELEYYFLVIERLAGIIEQQPDDPNFELHAVLFSINFNSPGYIKYCIHQLHKKYGRLSYTKQLEMYNWYIKSMNQVVRIEGIALLGNSHPAIDQIKNYIDQEINYIQTLIKLENGIIDGLIIKELNRILTSFSVPVIAVIFKAFFESGGLPYRSMAEAMRHFPSHFSTVGATEIGEESFKARVHNPEKAAVVGAISFFLKCIDVLRKYQ